MIPITKSAILGMIALISGFTGMALKAPAVRTAPLRDPGALCAVNKQWDAPDVCPSYGPAARRTEYWESGLLPRRPFPMHALDPDLGTQDRSYAKVNSHYELPVFKTLEDAIRNNQDHHLEKGFVYISYKQSIEQGGQQYLETGGGWFVRREDVSFDHTLETQFHGFTLTDIPPHPFGWVVDQKGAVPSRAPGQPADATGDHIPYYAFVEEFGSQDVDGVTWYELGLNQWLPQGQVGLVFPAVKPNGVPEGARWISINLAEQTLAAYEGDRLVFATLASTGVHGFWTRPDLFQIKKKWNYQSMSGTTPSYYFVQDVPYVMYFDSSRAIHGAYWHNAFGYPRSHGCVNLPVGDAHWVYDFASEGTWVYVFDPTGNTPTDPASYPFDELAP